MAYILVTKPGSSVIGIRILISSLTIPEKLKNGQKFRMHSMHDYGTLVKVNISSRKWERRLCLRSFCVLELLRLRVHARFGLGDHKASASLQYS